MAYRSSFIQPVYRKEVRQYIQKCPEHEVTFKTDVTGFKCDRIFEFAYDVRDRGNRALEQMKARVDAFKKTNVYLEAKEKIRQQTEALQSMEAGSKEYRQIESGLIILRQDLVAFEKENGISLDAFKTIAFNLKPTCFVAPPQGFLNSKCVSLWWSRISDAVQGLTETVDMSGLDDEPLELETRYMRNEVKVRIYGDVNVRFYLDNVGIFGVIVETEEQQAEYEALSEFLRDPSVFDNAVKKFIDTGELEYVYYPFRCSLLCKEEDGQKVVYIRLIIKCPELEK